MPEKIKVEHTGHCKDGAIRTIAKFKGSKVFYEENEFNIWITWMETPEKEQNKGQAKALISYLKSQGKPLRPGSFSPSGKSLEKYFKQ